MKIFYKITIGLFLFLTLSTCYLSFIGFETSKFNNQITEKIKEINTNLDIELKKIKITLNPLELNFNVKTIGPKFKIQDKVLGVENIKTKIKIRSIFNKDFQITNLKISTKTVRADDLASFIRIIYNKPELYIFEKITKKGFFIADVELNFDENGKIKNDLKINGFIKDLNLKLSKKYQVSKLNFIFKYEKNVLNLKDINFTFNDLYFSSSIIDIKNKDDNYKIKGEIENKNFNLNKKNINLFVKPYVPLLDFKEIQFNSNNEFSFSINKKFEFKDFELASKIDLNSATFSNEMNLKNNFPQIKKNINISDHNLQIKYKNSNLNIIGEGNILLQNKKDKLKYSINKKKNIYNFETLFEINNNPFLLDILNYKKNELSKAKIHLKGITSDKEIDFRLISIEDDDIKFRVEDLKLSKKFKILDLRRADANYLDNKKNNNQFKIFKNKDIFLLKGSLFNAEKLISDLLSNNKNKSNYINADFKLNVNIDKLYLDKTYNLKNFNGTLLFNNDNIINGNLIGFFSDNKKLKFTVNSEGEEKITTLFVDNAKPIIDKYKFIKGFNGGKLDFYSSKKGKNSIGTIKIYDFKLKELPFLTKVLTLASLQGIADLLSGEGIRFNEFEMNFINNKDLITINEIYAIGPAISILMDGYVEKDKLISMRGTLVPATTLNKVIGSIPLLGNILVGSKTGEGVFGVSFKIKGDIKNPTTTVNPIKTLTPRFITRTLEKIKKTN
jgi:hypothetical protein